MWAAPRTWPTCEGPVSAIAAAFAVCAMAPLTVLATPFEELRPTAGEHLGRTATMADRAARPPDMARYRVRPASRRAAHGDGLGPSRRDPPAAGWWTGPRGAAAVGSPSGFLTRRRIRAKFEQQFDTRV